MEEEEDGFQRVDGVYHGEYKWAQQTTATRVEKVYEVDRRQIRSLNKVAVTINS